MMMAYSLLGILICNILTLVAIAITGYLLARTSLTIKEQVEVGIHKVQEQVNGVLDKVRPIVDNVQSSTRHIRHSVENIRDSVETAHHTVREVEGRVTHLAGPVSALMVASRVLKIPGAKIGMVGLIVGSLLQLARKPQKSRFPILSSLIPSLKTGKAPRPGTPLSTR